MPRASISSSMRTSARNQQEVDAETTPLRHPELYQYDLNLADIAEVWRRGSVIASWLLDLSAQALLQSPDLADFSGRVSDSGEGRWTIQAAIDEGVPAAVLERRPVRPVQLARHRRLRRQAPLGHAVRVWRAPGKEGVSTAIDCRLVAIRRLIYGQMQSMADGSRKERVMPMHDWTLVAAGIFHAFHHRWISAISNTLNAGLLPPEYYALPEQQAAGFGPDVLTLRA